MALRIETQKDLRPLQRLSFCYLCGLPIGRKGQDPTWSREHVPPIALFLAADRTPPLILPAHRRCNDDQSGADQVIGELVQLLHGVTPVPSRRRTRLSVPAELPAGVGAIADDLKGHIWRWVRAFHTALYRDFLPGDTRRSVLGPVMAGVIQDGRALAVDDPRNFRDAVATLKNNAAVENVDAVVTRNGKCVYECVWDTARDRVSGELVPFCLFRLRVYNWERLSVGTPAPFSGCAGSYVRPRFPEGAARPIRITISGKNYEPFAAFERVESLKTKMPRG